MTASVTGLIRTLLSIFTLVLLVLGATAVWSQTQTNPAGTVGYTTETDWNCGQTTWWMAEQYSGWYFNDSSGGTHHFNGTSSMCIPVIKAASRLKGFTATSTDGIYSITTLGATGVVTLAPIQGFISPKYKIVGIAYSVPGTSSFVQYTDTTMLGTSSSTSNSFSTNVTTSESICGSTGGDVCGKGTDGVAVTGTYTNAFTQESDTSSSWAVNQTTSFVDKLYPLTGPALYHGNDVIYVWVNPNVWYTVTTPGAPLQWNGITYDLNDDSNNMEVIPLRLSELLNPSTIDAYTQGRLQRAWALNNTDGSSPAITNQDLLNMAAQDPFSNPNYTVTIGPDYKTTTDGRFTQTTNQELWYSPGEQNAYNWSYTGTATAGQGAKTTYSDSFSLEEKFGGGLFGLGLTYDLKQSTAFTWTDQWNKLITNMMGEAASVQVVGPSVPYTGPDEFNIYQDNVYGTFMVAPVPAN